MSNYVIWTQKREELACVLNTFENVDKLYEFRRGISRIDDFPKNALFTQDMDFPKNTRLIDNLCNVNSLIVASERLKLFLESRKITQIEYLPVSILDHQGNIASSSYYIIHPIHSIDCLDLEMSDPTWSKVTKNSIRSVKKLVLNEDKIPTDREMFRLQKYLLPVLVKRELAQAIDKASFSGIRWVKPENYPEN